MAHSSHPEKPTSKAEIAYQRIMEELPSRDRLKYPATEPVLAPEHLAYQKAREELSTPLQEALDAMVPLAEEVPQAEELRWCICESPEGEFARVRIFKELEGLARYLGRLEGAETSVWPFYGLALRFTKPLSQFYGRRLLLLPGEEEAIILPQSPAEPFKTVPLDLLEE